MSKFTAICRKQSPKANFPANTWCPTLRVTGSTFSALSLVTDGEVLKVFQSSPLKSSRMEIIPTSLFIHFLK